MAKKQSKKTGVVKSVLKSELEKTKLYQLSDPSLGQQILNTVSSITAPVTDLDINNEFKEIGLSFSNLANEYLDLVSYSRPFKDLLNEFDNTVNELSGSIVTYEQNPVLKQKREVEQYFKEFTKSKEKVKNELYYQLTENELQQTKAENKQINKELKKKAKQYKKLQIKLENNKKRFAEIILNLSRENTNKPINYLPKKLKLNTNLSQSEINDLYNDLKPYFVSNLQQWQNLFSKDIKLFDSPIRANKGVTIIMIATIFKELERRDITDQWKSVLEKSKAFKQSNKIITSTSLTDALRNKRKGYQPKRTSIIKLNYIKDIMQNYND